MKQQWPVMSASKIWALISEAHSLWFFFSKFPGTSSLSLSLSPSCYCASSWWPDLCCPPTLHLAGQHVRCTKKKGSTPQNHQSAAHMPGEQMSSLLQSFCFAVLCISNYFSPPLLPCLLCVTSNCFPDYLGRGRWQQRMSSRCIMLVKGF